MLLRVLNLKNGTQLTFATSEIRLYCAHATSMEFQLPEKLLVGEALTVTLRYRAVLEDNAAETLLTSSSDGDATVTQSGCENETVATFDGLTITPRSAGKTWCWARSDALRASHLAVVQDVLSIEGGDSVIFMSHLEEFLTEMEVRDGSGHYEVTWKWDVAGLVPSNSAPLPKITTHGSRIQIVCPSKIRMPAATLHIFVRDKVLKTNVSTLLRIEDALSLTLKCSGTDQQHVHDIPR